MSAVLPVILYDVLYTPRNLMCLMLGTWLLVSDVQEESASIDTRISNEDVVRNRL